MESRSRLPQPSQKIRAQTNSPLAVQHKSFPSTDRRHPKFICLVAQLLGRSGAKPFGALQEPDSDMGVQQKFQSRRASISSRSMTGETMSPRIWMESRIDPNKAARSTIGTVGTTSATGLPCRVMRMGVLVFSTRSRMAKHLALNSEIAISCMGLT